jgi:CheY-like chemotaxis protein
MNILAVDDDEDDLVFFKEVIHSIDPSIDFIFAHSCSEAYDILNRLIPDVIFLDINMPKVNGLDCFKYLKQSQRLRNVPVVFLSTAVNPINIKYLLSSTVKFIPKEPIFKAAKLSVTNVLQALGMLQVSS